MVYYSYTLSLAPKIQLMDIATLKERHDLVQNSAEARLYLQLGELLKQLSSKDLPTTVTEKINKHISVLNNGNFEGRDLKKTVKRQQTEILKFVEKELKIVPKNYYRNLWLALGMSAFGLPLGVAFGLSIGNMGLMALGLPIGMVIGVAVGSSMDKKALERGRQLDIEIKY